MKFFSDKMDKRYTKIALYVIGTFLAIMVIYQIINNIVPVVDWLLSIFNFIFRILQPVLIGFIIAYLLKPVMKFYMKLLSKVSVLQKKARQLAVLCSFLSVLLLLSAIGTLIAFSVTEQIRIANVDDIVRATRNFASSVNDLYVQIMARLDYFDIQSDSLFPNVENISNTIFQTIQGWTNNLLATVTNISGHFVTGAIGIVVATYLMLDGEIVGKLLNRIAKVIFSKRGNDKIHQLLGDLNTAFSGYIRGQLADVLFMMIAVSVTLLATGLNSAIVIGVLAGLGNLIPFVGPFIAYVLTIVVGIINADYQVMLISLIALVVIQFVDANIVAPKLMSRSIQIHPLLVMCFLVAGSAIGGLMGMLLAVPVGGFAKLVFMRWLEKRESKMVVEGDGDETKV